MKMNTFGKQWVIPVLGIALVGGGCFLMRSYLGFQEEIRSGEQTIATVDRLTQSCHLTRILAQAQDTSCTVTAQSLDELLAANIVAINSELASADAQTRNLAQAFFRYVARRRSQHSSTAAALPESRSDLQLAAAGVLAQARVSASPGY